jgi:transcriptional regulator with XRE-family HTH domain
MKDLFFAQRGCLVISADQIRAGRALARWSARELAERAGVGLQAVQRIENGVVSVGSAKAETIEGIQRALEEEGIVFLPDGYGVTKRQP